MELPLHGARGAAITGATRVPRSRTRSPRESFASVIKLECRCRATLNLPESLAGQKVRCKQCGKVLTVPRPRGSGEAASLAAGSSPSTDMLLVQGSRTCPNCGAVYPPSIVVCVSCGLNLNTGAMLYASLDQTPGPDGRPLHQSPPDEAPGWFQRFLRKLGFKSGT